MKKLILSVSVIFALIIGYWSLDIEHCFAGVPQMINYQGKLTDAEGNCITGRRDFTFKLWLNSTNPSTCVWTEPHALVEVTDGLFNVILGSVETDTLGAIFKAHDTLYMGITVEDDPEMTPRVRVGSIGYALKAEMIKGAGTTDNVFISSGNIGIGTTDPSGKLEVAGNLCVTGGFIQGIDSLFIAGKTAPDDGPFIELFGDHYHGMWPGSSNGISLFTREGGQILFGNWDDPVYNTNMVIKNNGSVGIGTTFPRAAKLFVKGPGPVVTMQTTNTYIDIARFRNKYNHIVAAVQYTGNYWKVSDARLKENIKNIDNDKAINMISLLRPVEFDWKLDKNGDSGGHNVGFIAQEVAESIPLAASKNEDNGLWGITSEQLIPYIVGAAQRLIKENEALKQRIEALEEKLGI